MRVAAVLSQYPPRTNIGAYIATHRWLTGLAKRHDVTVHRLSQKPRGLREHIDGVTVLPPSGKAKWDPEHPWRQADVIVSHLAGKSMRADAAHRFAREFDIPSVRIAHSMPVDGHVQLDGTRLLICNSQATADAIGWQGNTRIVHPAVFPDEHRTTPGSRITLVNLQSAKGAGLFWHLAEKLAELTFLAVEGWGTQIGPSGRQSVGEPSNMPPNVVWQPRTRNMRVDVWQRTRVLLMPSERESWGMVGMEAACSGIPVIAHPTPGIVEALGDTVTYVDRDDLDGWVDAVRRLDDPQAWSEASLRVEVHSRLLDPEGEIGRFCEAVESVT